MMSLGESRRRANDGFAEFPTITNTILNLSHYYAIRHFLTSEKNQQLSRNWHQLRAAPSKCGRRRSERRAALRVKVVCSLCALVLTSRACSSASTMKVTKFVLRVRGDAWPCCASGLARCVR